MSSDSKTQPREKVENIVEDFSTAMMVTQTADKQLRARPMQIASSDGTDLWFVSGKSSGKIDELLAHPSVCITLQSSSQYISLSGKMVMHDDRALIHKMWKESWKVWFPGGKDDPEITLLRFDSGEGEYWDNAGSNGIGMFLEMGKAYWTGKKPEMTKAVHGKVDL